MPRVNGYYICSVNPHDWKIVKTKGVYGNIDLESGGSKDTFRMSIIQDLAAIQPGDFIFFHVINEQKIFGVYIAKTTAFYDTTDIGSEKPVPNRILVAPHPNFIDLIRSETYISSAEFGELIEAKKILDISTIEREANALYHSVKRIFIGDALQIIRVLRKNMKNITRDLMSEPYVRPANAIDLPSRIIKLGNLEYSIKAVATIDLAKAEFRPDSLMHALELSNNFDFVFENHVSSTLKKEQDFFIKELSGIRWINCEFKAKKCDIFTVYQTLKYGDLIRLKHKFKGRMDSAIVGEKPRTDPLKETVTILNEMISPDKIINIWYIPDERLPTAKFEKANYPAIHDIAQYSLEPMDITDIVRLKQRFPYVGDNINETREAFIVKRGSSELPVTQNLGKLFVMKKTNIEKNDLICFMRAYRKRVLESNDIPMFSESIPVIIYDRMNDDAKKFVDIYNDSFIWRPTITLIKKE